MANSIRTGNLKFSDWMAASNKRLNSFYTSLLFRGSFGFGLFNLETGFSSYS
jgi:hypothetical protein